MSTAVAQDAPRALPVEDAEPKLWRFGEPIQLEAPEILWSQIRLLRFPVYNVTEGKTVYRWDDSAPWPGRFVPVVSPDKTLLDHPRELAQIEVAN